MTTPRRPPAGAGYLVFADVDETVIRCKSLLELLDHHFAQRHGRAGLRHAAAVRADLNAALVAGSSREEANRRYYAAWRGERLADVRRSGRDWYLRRRGDRGFFVEGTVAALHRHRAASAELALVSGSFAVVLEPLAEELGASHVLAAEPAVESGVLTGELVGPPMIGEGKRRAVRALLARRPAVDPGDCHAYGDHVSDLPMLQEVGHPTVVGGSPELLALLPGSDRLGADASGPDAPLDPPAGTGPRTPGRLGGR